MNEYYCPECGAILNEQPGFDPDKGTWTCTECGQFLMDDDIFDGDSFEGVAWYCDECGALLNRQTGFSDSYGTWVCTECGHRNGTTESDIVDDEFTCPKCGSTLNDQNYFYKYLDDWECTSCGAKLHHDYSDDEYIIVEDEDHLSCPNCGADLEDQSGFGRYLDDWECASCAAKLHHSYYDDEYSVVQDDERFRCPVCDAVLEDQFGYADYEDEWTCEECGAHLKHNYSSDPYTVVDDEIDDEDEEPTYKSGSRSYEYTSSSSKCKYGTNRYNTNTSSTYRPVVDITDEEFERAFAPKKETSKKKDRTTKFAIIYVVIVLLIPAIYFGKIKIDEINAKREGKINAGYYRDLVGEDYKYVVEHLEAAGFTYIELVDLDDSGILFWKEGKVENVSIGGDTSFESTDWFEPHTKVIVSYH